MLQNFLGRYFHSGAVSYTASDSKTHPPQCDPTLGEQTVRHFCPGVIFVGKAGAYPSITSGKILTLPERLD